MTLHLHYPLATEQDRTAACANATTELIMAIMAEPDLRRRSILASAAVATIFEALDDPVQVEQ